MPDDILMVLFPKELFFPVPNFQACFCCSGAFYSTTFEVGIKSFTGSLVLHPKTGYIFILKIK